MTGRASRYFALGHTSQGAHSLYGSAFRGLERIIVLAGPPGTGKSTVLRSLAESLLGLGQDVQCFHSALRPEELDGMIVTDLKVGIIDGQVSQEISESLADEIRHVDFEQAVDGDQIRQNRDSIKRLKEASAAAFSQAYDTFAAALRIHDEWEKYYIRSIDFVKAEQVTQALIRDLFAGREGNGGSATGRRLFFGAATPKGAYDFIANLTEPLNRRIFIKGRPGSGKSTLLKKLAAAAEKYGVYTEIFHCGFDPGSLDMLIFPELSTAIFDSTAPHEYFPERDGDEILDLYARTMTTGVDEMYAAELAAVKARYAAAMKKASAHLAEAETRDSEMKAFYTKATDFSIVESIRRSLQAELEGWLTNR